MKVICKLSRSKVLENQAHPLALLVRLRAPALPAEARRPPLCIVPVVDVSGSMAGAKLDSVRLALECLVKHLSPGDHVGLVTFDSDAHARFPIVEVTEERKGELRRLVRELRAGSNTNLSGGLLEALAQVERAQLPAALRPRLVVLTDGNANTGCAVGRDPLVALVRERRGAVSLSAFGYGDDCDQLLLADLAGEGAGSYAYIQNEDAVLTAFARELGGLTSTYASGVEIRVMPAGGGRHAREAVGDVLYEGETQALVLLGAPAHARANGVELAQVEVTWRDERGREQRAQVRACVDYVPAGEEAADDPEVARALDERSLRDAIDHAEQLARGDRFAEALNVLYEASRRIEDPQLVAFLREKLMPLYADRVRYEGGSAMRGSASAKLKGRRAIGTAEVEELLGKRGTKSEVEMEEKFRASAGKAPGKKEDS